MNKEFVFVFVFHLLFSSLGCLLIIFVNSLDQDQARQNDLPDLDPTCDGLKKFFLENFNFAKNQQRTKNYDGFPSIQS